MTAFHRGSRSAGLRRCSRSRRIADLACVLVLLAGTALEVSPGSAVAPPNDGGSGIGQQVGDAKAQLIAASQAVSAATTQYEHASAAMPGAQAAVASAQAAVVAAQQAEAGARARLAQTQQNVADQRVRIAGVQHQIDLLVARISALARAAYISGGEQQSLAVMMSSRTPADFATELAAQQRTARANGQLFDQAGAARQELAAELVTLRQLQSQASADAATAQQQSLAQQSARDSTVAAQQSLQTLMNTRQASLAEATNRRAELKVSYRNLVVEQTRQLAAQAAAAAAARQAAQKAAAHRHKPPDTGNAGAANGTSAGGSTGTAHGVGTARSPRQAVAWAMNYVGGGSSYTGMCLQFVDDAFGASSGRVGTAIAQWNRALAAGKGHPRDRNPPVGSQVFC